MMKTNINNLIHSNINKQNGSVLVIGLILIAVMTLIGISALNLSTQSEMLTSNQRSVDLSFQSTDTAVREAERWVNNQITKPNETNTCGAPPCSVWAANKLPILDTQSASYWATNARPFSGTLSTVSAPPRYFIEYYNFVPYELDPSTSSYGSGYHFYKITARGTGGTTNAVTIIESIYSTNFN